MKRLLSCALLLPVLFLPAQANSAPTRWEGSPGAEILAVEENCPISVIHEDLAFQIGQGDSYSLEAQVTARYQMENPTGAAREVQMAFSLEESVWDFDPASVSITADGRSIPFQMIWDGVSPDYQPQAFDPDQTGTLCTITLAPTQDGSDNTLTLPASGGRMWVTYDGIHSYSGEEDGSVTLGASKKATVLVYGLDSAPDYTVSGDYTVTTEELSFRTVLQSYLEERYGARFAGHLDSIQALKYRQLEELWECQENNPILLAEWMENSDPSALPLQLLYTVDFPPERTVEVAVAYTTRSDGVRKGTADWQHTFAYLLSPARHWADFGTLDLTVDAGESGYPYVIHSSLPLEEQPDGSYAAHAQGLPEEDLSFTLYSAPRLSLSDRVTSSLGITTYTLAFFRLLLAPLAPLVLLPALIVFLVWRRRRRRK
ncbi:MAG: hypothetical protein KH704_14930 [Clostridiales bacterium]|nr:hypothetical protein [Clostridiales bacterium]